MEKLEKIAISGISGRFPESRNLDEFKSNLFENIDMVTDDARRWTPGIFGVPSRTGKLTEIDKFDATFFGVHAKQANRMDPQLRILLETTYEAILDSGINPGTIRGQKIGVFVGAMGSETDAAWKSEHITDNGYGMSGCNTSMLANRISFSFDFKGPSFTLNTGCSSSLLALDQAVLSIRNGHCEAAVVAGVNLLLKPETSLQFLNLGTLSQEGKCKSFDISGNGYVRSEAVVSIYIQKPQDAKRIYATILHTKTNSDGFKSQGITYPGGLNQEILLKEIYMEAGIDPKNVYYVEAHGTGTQAGDNEESKALLQALCKTRDEKNPLLIGSVKSNMGHPEPASGLCGIAKIIIAIQNGVIPGNLWYENPIQPVQDKRIQVVNGNLKWNGGLVGVNSFGFGGSNVHVILEPYPKQSISKSLENNWPKIIPFSGRTKEAVSHLVNTVLNLKNDHINTLFHEIAQNDISGHSYRGFVIQNNEESDSLIEKVEDFKRPIWFVCSGMGSQWSGMGKDLFKFSTFANSIKKSAKILAEYNFDLLHLIENGSEFDHSLVLNSSISIIAIQVALVDLLKSLGIAPDGFLGHSIGEIVCAYLDECLTAEQTIRLVYARAAAAVESNLPLGGMAAVGLTWEEAKAKCPKDIFLACHNAVDSVTVSGPILSLRAFVEQLKSEGIFAKEVNSSGIAFHTKYIEQMGAKLKEAAQKLICFPKERSTKWISTCFPKSKWNTDGIYLNADYITNNALAPVLFYEALQYIPENALVIEIGPHCLLQPILKRALGPKNLNVGLMNRTQENPAYFLKTIGKIYTYGHNPKFSKLYNQVEFPVPIETPSISSLVQWDHSTSWDVASFHNGTISPTQNSIDISVEDENYSFADHVIDGKITFPATGFIFLVWKMFAKFNSTTFDQLPVVFEDLNLKKEIIMKHDKPNKFIINFYKGSNKFDVIVDGDLAASGNIRLHENSINEFSQYKLCNEGGQKRKHTLNTSEFYQMMKLVGMERTGVFKAVKVVDESGSWARVNFVENWIIFFDAMLTITLLQNHKLFYPTNLQKVTIDPIKFLQHLSDNEEFSTGGVPISHFKSLNIFKCEGIEFIGLKSKFAPCINQKSERPILEKYLFIPYFDNLNEKRSEYSFGEVFSQLVDVVVENSPTSNMKVLEVSHSEKSIEHLIHDSMNSQLNCKADIEILSLNNETGIKISISKIEEEKYYDKIDFLVINDQTIFGDIQRFVKNNGFVLLHRAKENYHFEGSQLEIKDPKFRVVSHKQSSENDLILLRKLSKNENKATVKPNNNKSIISIQIDNNLSWLEDLKTALVKSTNSDDPPLIFLISQFKTNSGIIGLINCLRKEQGGENIRCIFYKNPISTNEKKIFNVIHKNLMTKIFFNDLLMNVIDGEILGSFRHIELKNQTTDVYTEHAHLATLINGDISSLRWIEGPLKYHKEIAENLETRELCKVHFASLNQQGIMLASGKLSSDAIPDVSPMGNGIFGIEFAGVNEMGKRVMGIVSSNALATTVLADENLQWEIPENWSFEEAVTVPVAYATAYYALVVKGKIQKGESILIHLGSSCVGQAAISIAQNLQCKVFTTVDSEMKKNFLKYKYNLTQDSIAYSRDSLFEREIMEKTNGKGVDLVLNSLSGNLFEASVRCMAANGRFLEIGKVDLSNQSNLPLSLFFENKSFHGIDPQMLSVLDCKEKENLLTLVNEGIKNGCVKPMEKFIFTFNQIEDAFRFMAKGTHIGKVLIKMKNEENSKIPAQPRVYFHPQKTFIIIGGLGGFGLQLANWLVEKGVKNLVLVTPSGIKTGFQNFLIRRLRENKCRVVISQLNVINLKDAKDLLYKSNQLGPIGGIFNLAMVLKDGLMKNQTMENFQLVVEPKLKITENLDKLTREFFNELQYFVVFSSVSSGRGNLGQSNYGFANSAMERICEMRKKDGFPALAIQWGAIGEVGVVFDTFGNNVVIGGTKPQGIASCFSALEIFLQQENPVVSSMVVADKSEESQISNLKETSVSDSILKILGMKEILNEDLNLAQFGMDSLMSVEIKRKLKQSFGKTFTEQEIRELTFKEIKRF